MWHSDGTPLGHIPTLKEIKRILKDDGFLEIAVPHVDSFATKVFNENWYHLEIPIHLIAFSPDSITRMLVSARFKEKIYYNRRNSPLSRSLSNLKVGNTGCFLSCHASRY